MLASQVNGNIYITDDERHLIEANQQAIKIKDNVADIENEAVNQIIAKFDKCPATTVDEEKVVEAYNSYKEKLFNRYKLSKTFKQIGTNYVFEKDGYLFLSIDFHKGDTRITSGSRPNYWSYQRCYFQTFDTEGNIFLDIPYNIDINGTSDYAQTGCRQQSHGAETVSSTRYSRAVYPVFKGQTFKLLEGNINWFKVAYYEDRYYGYR